MKLVVVVFIILFCAGTAWAAPTSSTPAGPYSGSTAVDRGKAGYITSIEIRGDGTNSYTCSVKAGPDSSGSTLWPSTTVAAGDYLAGHDFKMPIPYSNGFYITVSGTGGSCTVYRSNEP